MPFVVKATGTGFNIMWLAVCDSEGSSTFGSSKDAVVFPTQTEAQEAADMASDAYGQLGMVFSVEFAD
jgi:hypothetical protein